LFAFALNPLLVKLRQFKKVKLSDVQAITVLVIGLFGVLILPLSIAVVKLANLISKMNTNQIAESLLVQKVQHFATTLIESVNGYAHDLGFDLSTQIDIKTHVAELGKGVLAFATAIVTNIPEALLQFALFIALLYYILLNQDRLKKSFIKTEILSEIQVHRLIKLFEKICYLVLVSTVLIAFLQATVVALGCLIVGYEGILIIFAIAFFLSFTPVLGSAPITISLIGYALLNGNYGHAVILVIVAILAATLDNVIKTYAFSAEEDSVSPLIALLAIIGSLAMFGPLGLFLGPVIAELAVQIGGIVEVE
ncbi:MAG: AI-2E family transporter, partial [Bdellovibrionaceae bacterium]|nr:AI-2E family transporter [Pseudobdellovibrionaceae bacterium]